ncbi:MAG: SulP family inorganic anion transporter [Zoogloeaceae bacterium]|nr:SulP family inorganic anion transporter [Rhodocyclaceae bacterium]MCP5237337.1 SulP family inorganic anion transporter [Zoogloeaceae bacterium]
MYSLQSFRQDLRGNLFGGVTAAVVALPLALAFGIASGAGPVAGLYGAIVVGFFAAVFGGTPAQISGPTGPMTVVMTAMTAGYAAEFPDQGLALAFTTVMLGGCFQILFGLARLGKYIIMVPYPVISGFMSGIGAIIILLQLGPLLGFAAGGSVVDAVRALPGQIAGPQLPTLTIGLLTLVIVVAWRGRAGRVIPSPLLGLIVATIAVEVFFPAADVARIGEIPTALPTLQPITFEAGLLQEMVVNALMLAVLGAIDSLLTSLVADNVTGTHHDSDRELIGQGIGNGLAGLLGGLPGAGATMRTVVNVRAGGSGPLSGAVHALLLLAIATGLGGFFESIPLAALAGILVKVGIDIVDWPFLRRMHRLPLFPVALMILVFALTVFVDLITAVFVGVFIKNLVTIEKLSHLQLGGVVLSDGLRDVEGLVESDRRRLAAGDGEIVLLRITGPVSYGVGRGLKQRVRQYDACRTLVVDISAATIIGVSTLIVLEELVRSALARGAAVKVIAATGAEARALEQVRLRELVGDGNCVPSLEHAL